jgi:hypothetical protein
MQPEFELYKKIETEYVIEIKNGKPHGYPIAVSNFICAYPHIDINNLPDSYAQFKPTERPNLNIMDKFYPYMQIDDKPTYRWFGSIIIEDWNIRPMTKKEILQKQTNFKNEWYEDPFNSLRWTFDEKTCSFVPPIPYPKDYYEKYYRWEDMSHSWKTDYFDPWKSIRNLPTQKQKDKAIQKAIKDRDKAHQKWLAKKDN